MPKRRNVDYLGDIVEAIELITLYTQGLSFDDFSQDRKNSRCCYS